MTPRERHLLTKFGITQEQYDVLLAKAGGGCALCGKTADEEGKALAVDHDHRSREVRSVLCSYCNRYVIGRHRDPDLLRRMAEYLEVSKTGWFVPVKKRRRKTTRKVK